MTPPKNIRITTYLKGQRDEKVLRAIWGNTHKNHKTSNPHFCSVVIYRANHGSCLVPLLSLDAHEIERLTPLKFKVDYPGDMWLAPRGKCILVSKPETLTISYDTLERLEKQLRRRDSMGVFELARLYANITKNWNVADCSVITQKAQGMVKVFYNDNGVES